MAALLLLLLRAGLLKPTSGDAYVSGLSVRHDMAAIRHSLGVCPQVRCAAACTAHSAAGHGTVGQGSWQPPICCSPAPLPPNLKSGSECQNMGARSKALTAAGTAHHDPPHRLFAV